MEDIDELKRANKASPKYILENGNVHVSDRGFHYLDYLDPMDTLEANIDHSALTPEIRQYIEESLQSNPDRFDSQVDVVSKYYANLENVRLLDIGCGGGLFLSKIAEAGGDVIGIELSDSRAKYAIEKHGLQVYKRPIESDFWSSTHKKEFDAITIWDVIEHVNYPAMTLKSATDILKSKGLIFIDTPCRDSFYHQFGELTYKLSRGRFPTFLNTMYSNHLYGHKQIFSSKELSDLLKSLDLEVLELKKFHELSFPYSYYLKKILKKDWLVTLGLPITRTFLLLFPVRNKMLIVAKKK